MRGFRVRYSLRQPGRAVETGAGWGPVSSSWAEMGSWAKGRAERSQVMLVRVVRAHKCPQGSEKAPLGARLQAGVCPVTEPCQELGGGCSTQLLLCGRAPPFGLGSQWALWWMENKLFVLERAKDWCYYLGNELFVLGTGVTALPSAGGLLQPAGVMPQLHCPPDREGCCFLR